MLWAICAAVLTRPIDVRAQDSATVRRTAESRIVAYLTRWQSAWKASDDERFKQTRFAISKGIRAGYLHCHPQSAANLTSSRPDAYPEMIREAYAPIVSGRGNFAKCPTWMLGEASSDTDESDSLDAALIPRWATAIARSRAELLARLDTLQRESPSDGWLLGQRVRFRTEAADHDGALRTLASCEVERWWCDALRGYVAHRRADVIADSLLLAAVAQMPEPMRCEWNDIGPLLDEPGRAAVRKLTCAARDSAAARFFWLADPLLSDATNERRAEHYARRVMLALHSALAEDERYHWLVNRGGDAVSEMLVRYGWPTAAMWTGTADDGGHDSYVGRGGRAASPYSTAEYSSGRVHFAPSWSAVLTPSGARAEDWQLRSPAGAWSTGDGEGRYWWPQEHMRERARVIVQAPAPGQMAFLPRVGGIRVLTALDWTSVDDPVLVRLRDSAARVRTTATSFAESQRVLREIVSDARASLNGRFVSDGTMTIPGEVLGVEVEMLARSAESLPLIGQARVGIVPDLPLDSLGRDAIGVSQPVLFASGADRVLPANAEELVEAMLATTTVRAGSSVGVYWENYGLSAGDSLRVSINLIPASAPGLLRRMATAVKLLDVVSSVTVQWTEPMMASRVDGASEKVGIRPRSVVLDLSTLKSGEYWIELVAEAGRQRSARSRRSLRLR